MQMAELNPNWSRKNERHEKNKLPHFVILGAYKSGTSSLFWYLVDHPLIFAPIKKELNYFSYFSNYSLEWYLSQFPRLPTASKFISGEASPSYFINPTVPKLVKQLMPSTKLICLLRNPIDRAYSHYQHFRRRGANWGNF